MFCENCGKKIPDGTQFCPYCGTPLKTTGVQKNQSEKTVESPMTLNAGKNVADQKKVITAVVTVVAIILLIAIPIRIHNNDLSGKFKSTAQKMQNDWPGSTAQYYDYSDSKPIPTQWPEMDYKDEVKNLQGYFVKGKYSAYFLLVRFDESSDCDAVMESYADENDYDKTSTGYRTDYGGDIERVDRKGNYILVSDYSEVASGLSEKFISKVGF